jgi:predicted nucleic acid-binding protein
VIFWDTSCVIPLLVAEPNSPVVRGILGTDNSIVVWWGTGLECLSAVARLERDGTLCAADADATRIRLSVLQGAWTEILPSEDVRVSAARLLLRHPLRAADALQLGAALVWCRHNPDSRRFIAFDGRLQAAARAEGFATATG